MMRRSKIKVRPAIKQAKPASKPKEIVSKPEENSPTVSISEVKKEKIVIPENPQVQAADTPSKPIGDDVNATAKIIKSDNVSDKSPATKPSITRRRKLVACPTMARKKPKISSPKVKAKESNEQKSVGTTQEVTVHRDEPTTNLCQATFDGPIIATPVPPAQVECDTTDDASTKDFVTLTPISQLSLNAEADLLNNAPLSQTFATSTQKIEGDHQNDKISNENASATSEDGKIIDSETSAILIANQVNNMPIFEVPIHLEGNAAAKAVKNISLKMKSATAKHRENAMAKLKKLKQGQEDSTIWPELDQNAISISDLIFLNPPNKTGHKLGMNAERETLESIAPPTPQPKTAQPETTATEEQEDTPLPVPQIRIAADGSVVIDEESLVLDTQKPPDPKVSTVYEFGKESMVNQCSFMRRPPCRGARWSQQETDKFYRCLCVVGAEFSLMSAMFKDRSADDLRRKFRRERKTHPSRVDNALMQQHLSKWTDEMFEHEDASKNNGNVLKVVPPTEETVK